MSMRWQSGKKFKCSQSISCPYFSLAVWRPGNIFTLAWAMETYAFASRYRTRCRTFDPTRPTLSEWTTQNFQRGHRCSGWKSNIRIVFSLKGRVHHSPVEILPLVRTRCFQHNVIPWKVRQNTGNRQHNIVPLFKGRNLTILIFLSYSLS